MPRAEGVATHSPAPPLVPRTGGWRRGAVSRALDWAERRSEGLERLGLPLFAAVSLLYWVITPILAARKLLWNDELYTYYVASLPSMRDVWQSLLAGGEQTPPFFYFATRVTMDLFGGGPIAIRLPAMLGVWLMSVCLLVFVGRRTSSFPALCAAAFPHATMAYYYAFEARAYGLVLGFAALALLAWQSLAYGRHRLLWLVCLAASLSAAVSTHYYAVLVLIPLAMGEATRTSMRRRVDLPAWGAMVVPLLALGLHLPVVRAGQRYSSAFWAQPQWLNVPRFYEYLLGPTLLAVMAILVGALLYTAFARREARPLNAGSPLAADAEIVAACGFILIPFVCVVIAKVVTGAFTDRYALPAVIGFAVLAGFGTAAAFRRQPLMRAAAVAVIVGWFALSQAREYVEPTGASLPVTEDLINRPVEWLTGAPAEVPLVIADPHSFAVFSHYAPPAMKTRLVYLADPGLAQKHLGHNSVERGMVDLVGPWFGMNVRAFEPFLAEHPQFLLYGDFFRMAFLNWIFPELRARGLRMELLNRQGDNLFLLVTRDGAQRRR